MADRSFEEQVRTELEALRIAPDPRVWENVDTELRKERKHRWVLWFILVTGLAGSAGLYYQFSHTSKDTETSISEKQPASQPDAITVPGKDTEVKYNDAGRKESKPAETVPTTPKQQRTGLLAPANASIKKSLPAADIAKQQPAIDRAIPAGDVSENKPVDNVKTSAPVVTPPVIPQQDSISLNTVSTTEHQAVVIKEQPVSTVTTDSVQPEIPPGTVTAVTSVVKPKKKWQLFGTVDMGKSAEIVSLRNAGRLFAPGSQNISRSADFAAGNAIINPPGSSTPGSGSTAGVLYRTPSRTDGFSFGVNLQALKAAGKKGSIGVSVGYSYYTSILGIGRKMNNSAFANQVDVHEYYLSTDSVSYRNRHHFLSLNGDYYLNFRLGPAASLRWRMGAGMGLLLASNALHFDADRGILYERRSSLSAVQTNISTGLELGIGKKQAFYIGPQLTYFLGVSSRSTTSDRHLFNAALRAGFAIPQKKK